MIKMREKDIVVLVEHAYFFFKMFLLSLISEIEAN